jgi:hypothetical protein
VEEENMFKLLLLSTQNPLSLSLSLSLSRVCDFFFLLNISCFVFQKTKYLLSGAMGNVIIFLFSLIIA